MKRTENLLKTADAKFELQNFEIRFHKRRLSFCYFYSSHALCYHKTMKLFVCKSNIDVLKNKQNTKLVIKTTLPATVTSIVERAEETITAFPCPILSKP